MLPLVALLLLAPAPPTIDRTFAMSLRGERFGLLHLRFDGTTYRYESLTAVRRGATTSTVTFTATTDAQGHGRTSTDVALQGPLPSTLALWSFGDGEPLRCVEAEDERDGRRGEVCASRRGLQLAGTLLGEPFQAELDPLGPAAITFGAQQMVLQRIDGEPPLLQPRDLFARGAPAQGLEALPGLAHARIHGSGSACTIDLELSRAGPTRDEPLGPPEAGRWAREAAALGLDASGRWATARALARFVNLAVASTEATPAGEDAAQAWRDRRCSCLGQAQLFVALARGRGLPARVVYGALLEDGQLAGHAWAEVEVRGLWYGVDPSRAELPVGLSHLPLSREGDADPLRAGRCLLELPRLRWHVEAVLRGR